MSRLPKLFILAIVVQIAVSATVIYVAIHFIRKFW
jgi:hypothetical protein